MSAAVSVERKGGLLPPRELWGRMAGRVLLYGIAAIASIFFMIPFVWALLSSLKTIPELYTYPPTWFPIVPVKKIVASLPSRTWIALPISKPMGPWCTGGSFL